MLNQVADNIVDVVHFDRCRIYLLDMETGRFSPRIVRGFRRTAPDDLDDEVGMGVGVIGHGRPAADAAAGRRPRTDARPIEREYGLALEMDAFYAQPIVARGRCIGVIVVSNTGPQRAIARADIELLSTFVHQAGIAIENARIIAGQEKRYAELTTLYEVSKTLAATSGVQKAAQTVNDLATQITDSDAGLLLLFDDSQEGLSALHWRGVSEASGQAASVLYRSGPRLGPGAGAARAAHPDGGGCAATCSGRNGSRSARRFWRGTGPPPWCRWSWTTPPSAS